MSLGERLGFCWGPTVEGAFSGFLGWGLPIISLPPRNLFIAMTADLMVCLVSAGYKYRLMIRPIVSAKIKEVV